MVWQAWLVITVHTLSKGKCYCLSSYLSIHPWTLHYPSPLSVHIEQKLCGVMEVCIDPARRWGWHTNRVNRINGAVTLQCGGVSAYSLAVCKLLTLCSLWIYFYSHLYFSHSYVLSQCVFVSSVSHFFPSSFLEMDKGCFNNAPLSKCPLFIQLLII